MKKIAMTLTAVLFVAACSTYKVDSNEYRTKFTPAKVFNAAKEKCFNAALAALKEREYKVKASDLASGSIETEKRKFNINATISSRKTTTMAQLQQADKQWLKIASKGNTCEVSFVKSRLWNGEEELTEVQGGGGDWAKEHLTDAFYKEMDQQLTSN